MARHVDAFVDVLWTGEIVEIVCFYGRRRQRCTALMLLLAALPCSLLRGRAARAPRRARATAAYVDLEMEVAGVAEALRLSSPEDPARIAAELAAKVGGRLTSQS